MFTQDSKGIVVCSSSFQSQSNQTAIPVMEEITADQILDMPIVFADESPQEEGVKSASAEDSSYIISSTKSNDIVVKEEPLDEDENLDVMCPTSVSRTAIPERLKIKQVLIL